MEKTTEKKPFGIANILTTVRIALIPVMIVLFYSIKVWGGLAAAAVFGIASLTDCLDGVLARKKGEVSDFGKIYDPLADKLLMAAALVILTDLNRFTIYFEDIALRLWGAGVALLLMREFVIGMIRQVAALKGSIVSSVMLAKLKTLFVTLGVLILFFIGSAPGFPDMSHETIQIVHLIGFGYFGVGVALALVSLAGYLYRNRTLFADVQNIKEIPLLNEGRSSAAIPAPGTVYAVRENYPAAPHQAAAPAAQAGTAAPQVRVTPPPAGALIGNVDFDKIVLYVIQTQTAVVSKIQEAFGLDYSAASKAIERMEEAGYVTRLTPTAKRRVLITREQYLSLKK